MTPINENTSGRVDAQRALAESQQSSRRADNLITETRAALDRVREAREANHFADKIRTIIRGAA